MGVSRAGMQTVAAAGIYIFAIIGVSGTQRQPDKVPAHASKVSSLYLEITSYVTSNVIAPGERFSVVLAIEPGPGIHVYAPEVKGYKPVRLIIQPRAGVVVRRAQYPRSEDYFFPALEEHVPVYQSPFRIVQDLMIDPSRKGQAALAGMPSVTIQGALEYQACDDKICFRAQSVPLSWEVRLRPIDRGRAGRP
jgi:DsbC/DsbD-like thiol-disulfide interchange protein